jgi:hypothetical protein
MNSIPLLYSNDQILVIALEISVFSIRRVVLTRMSFMEARFLISLNSSSMLIGVVLPPPLISEMVEGRSGGESRAFSENLSEDSVWNCASLFELNLALNAVTAGSATLVNSGRSAGALAQAFERDQSPKLTILTSYEGLKRLGTHHSQIQLDSGCKPGWIGAPCEIRG